MPPASSIRYGIGVWREAVALDGTLLEASSLGAFGLSPWIDIERQLVGVLLVQDQLPDVVGTYLELKRLVREIVDGTSVGSGAALPEALIHLGPPTPNPARRESQIRYTLAQPATVEIVVLDALGRRLIQMDLETRPAGPHQLDLDLGLLAPGVYRVVLQTEAGRVERPLSVVR